MQLTLLPGDHALFLHGAPTSEGAAEYDVTVDSVSAPLRLLNQRVSLGDDVMLDVRSGPAEGYDVHSVLVPDGPTEVNDISGAITVPGNDANDWQGVLATALWAFDERGRIVRADLAMSGVGAAGRLSNVDSRVAFVLARAFDRPPFGIILRGSLVPTTVSNRDYPYEPGQGRLRLVLNPHRDLDGDNLSDQVEQELHTCDGLNPITTPDENGARWACMTEGALLRYGGQAWMDPRDTDGDGISDGAEVLGTDNVIGSRLVNGAPSANPADIRVPITNAAQTLPQWGFDPRHKDVLIEIDRMRVPTELGACSAAAPFAGCAAVGSEPPVYPYEFTASGTRVTMSVQQAFEALWQWRLGFSRLPATRIRNPDGRFGIEMHFDVSIAGARDSQTVGSDIFSNASRRLPLRVQNQVVPHRIGANGLIERFGKAGLVIFSSEQSNSQCACGIGLQAPDPRHGGLAYHAPLLSSFSGSAGCAGAITATALDLPGTTQHEFGHVLGLDHGGPMNCNENPFAPPVDQLAYTSKAGFWSIMNYAFQFSLGRQRETAAWSLGRNRNYPSPALVTGPDGSEVIGYQERNTFGHRSSGLFGWTDTMKFYGFQRVVVPPIDPVLPGQNRWFSSVDFDRNGEVSSEPIVGPVTPSRSYAGGGTFLLRINNYYSPVDDAFVSRAVCPDRTASVGGIAALVCRRLTAPDSLGGGARVSFFSPTEPNTHTMTAVSNHAPVIANNRIYDLYLDDVVSQAVIDTEPPATSQPPMRCTRALARAGACTFWEPRGKLRWMAIDQIGPREKTSSVACSAPDVECGFVDRARASGDILVDGAPLQRSGSTVISAAVVDNASSGPTLFATVASRTGVQCSSTAGGAPVDCPWGEAVVLAGSVGDIESSSSFATRVALPASWRRPIAAAAVAAWDPENEGRPTAATVVVRLADSNFLSWATCSTAVCSDLQPLEDTSGNRLDGLTQLALSVQSIGGARTLGLVVGARRLVDQLRVAGVVLHKINRDATRGIVAQTTHELHATFPSLERHIIATAEESGLSAVFDSSGRLVLSAEVAELRPTLFVGNGNPFSSGTVSMVGPGFDDWWASRRFWEGRRHDSSDSLSRLAPSPGAVWGLVFDDRPASVAIRELRPTPQSEEEYSEYNATLRRNFAGQVRAFAREFVGGGGSGPWVKFIARADGRSLSAQHDFDESSTLAFNLCRNIHTSSAGVRGGDTRPRRITDTNADGVVNPIFCPSGASYSEDSSVLLNRFADRVIASGGGGLRQCPWCDSRDFDIVVDLLSARNWGRSASPDTAFIPSGPVPAAAGCSAGAGISAWDRASAERAQ